MISGSFTDLTWVDFTPDLVLNRSSRGTHLSCSLYHQLQHMKTNSASIYSLRETSNLLSLYSGGGILYLIQPENQDKFEYDIHKRWDQVAPSICHCWYCTTVVGPLRRECQIFRDYEPSLLNCETIYLGIDTVWTQNDLIEIFKEWYMNSQGICWRVLDGVLMIISPNTFQAWFCQRFEIKNVWPF